MMLFLQLLILSSPFSLSSDAQQTKSSLATPLDVLNFCNEDFASVCPADAINRFQPDQEKKFDDFMKDIEAAAKNFITPGGSKKIKTQGGGPEIGGSGTVIVSGSGNVSYAQIMMDQLKLKLMEIDHDLELILIDAKKYQSQAIDQSPYSTEEKMRLRHETKTTQLLSYTKLERIKEEVLNKMRELNKKGHAKSLAEIFLHYRDFVDGKVRGLECLKLEESPIELIKKLKYLEDSIYGGPRVRFSKFNEEAMSQSWNSLFRRRLLELAPLEDLRGIFGQDEHAEKCEKYVSFGILTDEGEALKERADTYQNLLTQLTDDEKSLLGEYFRMTSMQKEFVQSCGDFGLNPNSRPWHYYPPHPKTKEEKEGYRYILICEGDLVGAGKSFKNREDRMMRVMGHEMGHFHVETETDPLLNGLNACYLPAQSTLPGPAVDYNIEMDADYWGGITEASYLQKDLTLAPEKNLDALREGSIVLCMGTLLQAKNGVPKEEGSLYKHPPDRFRVVQSILKNDLLKSALGCIDLGVKNCSF